MNINDYQAETASTAIYPEAGTGSAMALAYVGLGLGEVGEIQGKLKKVLRDDDGILTETKRSDLIKEMGDALWYLARLADEIDTTLGYVASVNLSKLESRRERGTLTGSGDDR